MHIYKKGLYSFGVKQKCTLSCQVIYISLENSIRANRKHLI